MEGQHESVWIATAPGDERPPLEDDLEVDVAVVGAGITGITTAYLLQTRGKEVALLERDRIVRGVTGHTTAKLTTQHGAIYHQIADRFGDDQARVHADANQTAMRWARDRIRDLGIDAALEVAPAYTYTTDGGNVDMLRREADVARGLGLPASFVTDTELPFAVKGAVRFEDQAQLHPRRYLLGLAAAFEAAGGKIFERTAVTSIRDGNPCHVEANGVQVTAEALVVATNVPINDRLFFVTRMKPSREYGIAAPSTDGIEGMYINVDDPRRSVRPWRGPDGPMLLVVGEKHDVGHDINPHTHHDALIRFAREHFKIGPVAYGWSTQDYYPTDGLPYVGRTSPGHGHVWTATGFQGWGMTQGTAAALMLSDVLTGKENPWLDLYDPYAPGRVARDLVRPELIKLQAHVATMFVGERVRPHEPHDLPAGDGAIVSVDGQRLAVHRDLDGVLHACAAECSHMGCLVNWNRDEQSWDCPCHGSRFSGTGRVLHGPATTDLATRTVPGKLRPSEASVTGHVP